MTKKTLKSETSAVRHALAEEAKKPIEMRRGILSDGSRDVGLRGLEKLLLKKAGR